MSATSLAATSASAGELHRIVQANEEIKSVVRTAFRIGVMALNAILLSRRAGGAAVGFGVLSDELRRFAADLSQRMSALRELTAGAVGAVTSLVRDARYLAILERVVSTRAEVQPQVADVRERARQRLRERAATLAELQERLDRLTGAIGPLVQLGIVLARSARIEAAYGGPFAPQLTQVSIEFNGAITDIEKALEQLHRPRPESRP